MLATDSVVDALVSCDNDMETVKQAVQETSTSPVLRRDLGADPKVWAAVLAALDKSAQPPGEPPKLVFSLITNISASEHAAELADRAGVIGRLIDLLQGHTLSPAVLPSAWQGLSNLSQTLEQSCVKANIAPAYAQALEVAPLPALRLIDTDLRKFHSVSDILNKQILDPLLEWFPRWYDDEESQPVGNTASLAVSLVTSIFTTIVQEGKGPQLLDFALKECGRDSFVTALKIVDASLSLEEEIRRVFAVELAMDIQKHLRDAIEYCTPLFKTGVKSDTAVSFWTSMLVSLESLTLLAPAAKQELCEAGLVTEIITLLNAARELPTHKKAAPTQSELDPEEYPLVKSAAIPLLSILVAQNTAAQDQVRRSGGLAAVLEACAIDENNPFARERAIVCIRYLLDNNQTNQDFVAQLEAKKVVTPKQLAQAGYETELVNGKVQLKKGAQN